MEQKGGAVVRQYGQGYGYVYVMHVPAFKIGYTTDLTRRFGDVQREGGNQNVQLLDCVLANEENGAERAAQRAVIERLGLVRDPDRGNATDWLVPGHNNFNVTPLQVFTVVKQAVQEHNPVNEQ